MTPTFYVANAAETLLCHSFVTFTAVAMRRGRPPKRSETTHRCIEYEDGYGNVHFRTSHTDQLGHVSSSQPQPLHGKAGWSLGNTWIPPDDSELSLDMDGRDYEDQMNSEVFESSIFQDNAAEVQRSSRSKVSVGGKSCETSLDAKAN